MDTIEKLRLIEINRKLGDLSYQELIAVTSSIICALEVQGMRENFVDDFIQEVKQNRK